MGMIGRRALIAGLAAAMALAHATAWAHHSVSALFDANLIALKGTMTRLEWVNPHIIIYVTVDGSEWKLESSAPSFWRSVGVRAADFTRGNGQPVAVELHSARSGAHYGYLRKITFANGDFLEATSSN
jgi:hypothetical protein